MKTLMILTILFLSLLLFPACDGTSFAPVSPMATPALIPPAQAPAASGVDWSAFQWLDEDGIPQVRYWDLGLQYSPLMVIHYAIAAYSEMDVDVFLRQIDWLMEQRVERDGFTVWEYDFDYPAFNVAAPWISGLTQGAALLVMIQAYSLTGDGTYLDVGDSILRVFTVPVEDGGVLRPDGWYEEYAAPGADFTKVLNGHISAVINLHRYHEYTGNELALELYERGLETIRRELPNFDLGGWLAYDGKGQPATQHYHNLVRRQLWFLWVITEEPFFHDYAQKFQGGTPP